MVADSFEKRRYANVTPSLSGWRQATRTSRISPLCPTMTVNVSGRPSASTTVNKAPKAERSASVHETRLPLSVRICAGKFVAVRRSSRRFWVTAIPSNDVLTSDQHIDDLADGYISVLWCGRGCPLLDRDWHRPLNVARYAVPYRLQLRRAEHREVVIRRNADHGTRLHSAKILPLAIKRRLKPLLSSLHIQVFAMTKACHG